jgi:GNAT superfamily N-acetyltransferase
MMNNGFHKVPAGKIATVVTYLGMHAPPARNGPITIPLNRLTGADYALYRMLFRQIGERWLWWSRLGWSDNRLATHIGRADIEAFAVIIDNEPSGLLELDFSVAGEAELAFFGLTENGLGKGYGRALMNAALERAWSRPIRRLWVHTCTFDHPAALNFYIRSGFRPERQEIEIDDDPRLTGLLSRSAAPHVPILEG